MRINIYQLDSDKDENRVKFCNYDFTQQHGGVLPQSYKCVFHGDVDGKMWMEIWKMSSRCSIHPSIPEPTRDIHSRFRM